MPLTVRNEISNTTVFSKTMNGDPVRIIWGPSGQHNDTQRVPDSFADDIDFLNALDGGVFAVTDGPEEIVTRLQRETSKARELREEQERRAMASIERTQDRDMIGAQCIAPQAPDRPNVPCGRSVLISHKQANEVPPLCQQHQHLAPEYFLFEEGSKGEGATQSREGVVRREWRRTTLTAPVKVSS